MIEWLLSGAVEPGTQLAYWFQLALIVVAVVLTVVAELLRPKPDIEDARPASLGDFNFPTATEDRAIPVVFGSVKIAGPNVIWYGDLYVQPVTEYISSGYFSGDRIITGYRYFLGIQFAISHGVIDELYRIDIGEKLAFPTGDQAPLTSRTEDILLNLPLHFGGDEERGGVGGEIDWYPGTGDTTDDDISEYMAGQIAGGVLDDTPAFVNIAHVVWKGPSDFRTVAEFVSAPSQEFPSGETVTIQFPNGYLGTQSNIEPWAFYVRRFPNQLGLAGGNERIGDDANPACVLYETLTDDVWGLNVDPAAIDVSAFQSVGDTLASEGNGFSLVWASQRSARDLAKEVIRQIDGTLVQDVEGRYTLRLIRAPTQSELDNALVLDETNVLSVKEFTRTAWNQTFNHIQVNYTDRDKDFSETSAIEQDLANFSLQGDKDVVASSEWPGVKDASVARQIARRELRQLSFPLAKISLEVNREASSLLPGDIAKFSWPELGIQDMILRVATSDLGELANGRVDVEAVEDVFGLGYGGFDAPPASDWVEPQAAPVDATRQYSMQMPGIIAKLVGGDPLNDARLMTIVEKTQGAAIGWESYWNFGDPATQWGPYSQNRPPAGAGFTPTADLVNILASYDDGDEVVASIDLENPSPDFIERLLETVETQDLAGLREGRNLIMLTTFSLIGNGTFNPQEFMAFESLTDNGDGTYTLNNVHRGLGDTSPVDWAAGSRVYFLDLPDRNAFQLTDNADIYPGWDGGSQSSDLVTDTRNQISTPFGKLPLDDASQQQVTIPGHVTAGNNDGTRIFLPLVPFGVRLLMDDTPASPPTTPYYVAGHVTRADNIAPIQDIAGIDGALDCRLTWKAQARNSATIKLPGDAADILDATSEPGEYPVSSPNVSTDWEVLIFITGYGSDPQGPGLTQYFSNVRVDANAGQYDFSLPSVAADPDSEIIGASIRLERRDGGGGSDEVWSRSFYRIWFRRV